MVCDWRGRGVCARPFQCEPRPSAGLGPADMDSHLLIVRNLAFGVQTHDSHSMTQNILALQLPSLQLPSLQLQQSFRPISATPGIRSGLPFSIFVHPELSVQIRTIQSDQKTPSQNSNPANPPTPPTTKPLPPPFFFTISSHRLARF